MSTSNSNVTNIHPLIEPAYEVFRGEAGFVFLSKVLAPMFFIALIGIILNSSLIYVTIRQRSKLNGSFSTLIACEALGSLSFELNYFLKYIFTISGNIFVKGELCLLTKLWTPFGMGLMYTTMPAIGIERLVCVLFPIWFAQNGHLVKCYTISIITLGTCYGIVGCAFQLMDIVEQEFGKEVFCNFAAKLGVHFGAFQAILINWYLQMLTVAAYACIWLLMLRGWIKRIEIANTYNLHILKSISVIMTIVMFCWILQGYGPFYWTNTGQFSMEQLLLYKSISLDIMLFATLVNAPILFVFSKEYRRCYQKTFPCLKRGGNQVSTGQQQGFVTHPNFTTFQNGSHH